MEKGGKEGSNRGEESEAQAAPCGGLGGQNLTSLPTSLSISVAVTVLGMMDICFVMGVVEGSDNVDIKKVYILLQKYPKCIFYSKEHPRALNS